MQPSDETVEKVARFIGENCYSIKWGDGAITEERMAFADAATLIDLLASLNFGDLTAAREAGRREGLEWAQNECLTQAHYQGAFGDRDKMAGCEWMSAKIGEAIRALMPETQKAPQP